ncbi:Uncharacterised protein [Mycobacteroides abscessus]|nr:Uncharacterised protein [Mycobacteroides abscessus]
MNVRACGPASVAPVAPSRALTDQPPAAAVKTSESLLARPAASKTSTSRTSSVPSAASEGRLPPNVTPVVARGGMTSPTGIVRFPSGLLVFTTPSVAVQPWTRSPLALTRRPAPSNVNPPLRV